LGRAPCSSAMGSELVCAWPDTTRLFLLLARDQQLHRVSLQPQGVDAQCDDPGCARVWRLEPLEEEAGMAPSAEVVHMEVVGRRGHMALLTVKADGCLQLWQHDDTHDTLRAAHAPIHMAPLAQTASSTPSWRRLGGLCVPRPHPPTRTRALAPPHSGDARQSRLQGTVQNTPPVSGASNIHPRGTPQAKRELSSGVVPHTRLPAHLCRGRGRARVHARCVSELHPVGTDGTRWLLAVSFLTDCIHVVDVLWAAGVAGSSPPRMTVHAVATAAVMEVEALGRPCTARRALALAFVRQTRYRHGGDALHRHVLAVRASRVSHVHTCTRIPGFMHFGGRTADLHRSRGG